MSDTLPQRAKTDQTKVIIASNPQRAMLLRDALGLPPDQWMAIGIGAALAGRRLDQIVLACPIERLDEREKAWFRESVMTCLMPDGRWHAA